MNERRICFPSTRLSRHITAAAAALAVAVASPAAFADEADDNVSFSLSVTTDTFFGFAPMATGSVGLTDKLAFTVYGIYWSGGTGAAWGNWAEFGAGISLDLGAITLTPQIGLVNGNLLSKGAADGVFGGVIADGIVPNLTVDLDAAGVEGQIYVGYYAPLRTIENPETGSNYDQTAYIHYWTSAGYGVLPWLSFGAHFEHLWGGAVGEGENVYQWIGPYVQVSMPSGRAGLSFAGGTDLVEGADSFYKMSMVVNF